MEFKWKEAVNTFKDLYTTYPNAEEGWVVDVLDEDGVYMYKNNKWNIIFPSPRKVTVYTTNPMIKDGDFI